MRLDGTPNWPELASLPEKQRRTIWYFCVSRASMHWMALAAVVLSLVVFYFAMKRFGIVVGLPVLIGLEVLRHAVIIPLLARQYLPRALLGHCRNCGYDMHETPERCPECGAVRGFEGPTDL